MEGTVALKWALVARGILDHATVRSPLLPLAQGAEGEIAAAMRSAGLGQSGVGKSRAARVNDIRNRKRPPDGGAVERRQRFAAAVSGRRKIMKKFAGALFAAAALCAPMAVHGQTYPSKVVRIVVPYPPGGTVDAVARVIAQRLSESLGQQFIVDNRPGASGTIGSTAVAKSPADGYTLLVQASTFVAARC